MLFSHRLTSTLSRELIRCFSRARGELKHPISNSKQFTDYYYQTFDADRNGLAPLYVRHPLVLPQLEKREELTSSADVLFNSVTSPC